MEMEREADAPPTADGAVEGQHEHFHGVVSPTPRSVQPVPQPQHKKGDTTGAMSNLGWVGG